MLGLFHVCYYTYFLFIYFFQSPLPPSLPPSLPNLALLFNFFTVSNLIYVLLFWMGSLGCGEVSVGKTSVFSKYLIFAPTLYSSPHPRPGSGWQWMFPDWGPHWAVSACWCSPSPPAGTLPPSPPSPGSTPTSRRRRRRRGRLVWAETTWR